MAERMCKVCWEMVDEAGPCLKPALNCGLDFGTGVEDSGSGGQDGSAGPAFCRPAPGSAPAATASW